MLGLAAGMSNVQRKRRSLTIVFDIGIFFVETTAFAGCSGKLRLPTLGAPPSLITSRGNLQGVSVTIAGRHTAFRLTNIRCAGPPLSRL